MSRPHEDVDLELGQRVRIKPGTKDPDIEGDEGPLDIGGLVGHVTQICGHLEIGVQYAPASLKQLHKREPRYTEICEEAQFDPEVVYLKRSDLDKAVDKKSGSK